MTFREGATASLSRKTILRSMVWGSLLWVLPFVGTAFGKDWTDAECMKCHGDMTELPEGGDHLLVDLTVFHSGPHEDVTCSECHDTIDRLPHEARLAPVRCESCHEDSMESVAHSVHADLSALENPPSSNCTGCHGAHDMEWVEGEDSRETGEREVRMCLKCHGEQNLGTAFEDRALTTGISFLRSVHFHALREGDPDAPSCLDCHGSHTVLSRTDPNSPIHPSRTSETCGQCHTEIAETFMASVHGQSLLRGHREAPECTTCHRTHDILEATAESALTSPRNVSDLCASCHSSSVVTDQFENLTKEHSETFFESIHGRAAAMGNLDAANCASCHGVHNIFPSSDVRSTVHSSNLLKTCQECHPKAGPKFVEGKIHVAIGSTQLPMLISVRTLYLILIVMTLGFMVSHNGLVIFRHVLDRIRAHRKVPTVRRFKKIHLVQHHIIAVAFVLLAVTGFALKFPDSSFTHILTRLGMTETVRAITHRLAATTAIVLFVFHLIGLFFTKGGKKELTSLMLRWKDLTDFFKNVAYNLGLTETPPRFDRYTYWEKIEYWALAWGMIIMALTGLTLWFPELASWIIPRKLISIAGAVHFYEACLAVGAIFCWHLFFAVYHPKEYPISTAMITGEITESHMREIHGMEYERMKVEQMKNIRIPPGEDLQIPQEI